MSGLLFRGLLSESAGPDQRLDFSSPTDFGDYPSSSRPLSRSVTGSAASSHEENLETEAWEPPGIEAHASIYTLYHYCLLELNDLLVAIRNSQAHLDVDFEIPELRSRLQIWAGNHGAHRRQEDRLSLDYRLREAPELHKEVRDHFHDIINSLGEAITAITTSEVGIELLPEEDSSSSSGSEGSLTSSQKVLIGMSSTPDPPNSKSRLQDTRKCIDNVITSLYKFSITIQNPAHRDRTARAAKIDVSFWHEHDVRHVQDKFRSCSDSKLLQKLAQANTKRRQLFEYHKRHRNKIQHYQQADVQEVPAVLLEQLESTKENLGQIPHLPAVSTIRTGKTKLTMTTVSTINPLIRNIAPSVSVRSRRTNISIDPLSASNNALKIPPPPNHSGDFSELFICPYCFSTIDPTDKKSWEHHVLDDLRPYLCTFADCTSVPVLYERYSEWSTHELEVHRREWFCNFCKDLYDTRDEFVEHLRLFHQNLIGNASQAETLISFCERISTRDEDCALCGEYTGKPHEVQEHLAHHLRQLALYTLPRLANNLVDESEAGSDIAHVHNTDNAPSDNTQTELLNIPMDYEQQYSVATPLDSPPLNVPDLVDPISWEYFQDFSLSSSLGHFEEEYQKLVKSFSTGEEDKPNVNISGVSLGPFQSRDYSLKPSHQQHRDAVRAIMFSYARIKTAMGVYKEGFESIAGWSRYKVEFDSFVQKIRCEEEILETSLFRLLPRGFHKEGIEQFDGISLFTASETLRILESRIEDTWDSYMYCLGAVQSTLSEIKSMLSLNEHGHISWEDFGLDKWYLQLVRVCQDLSRKGPSLHASLSQGTRRLQDLLAVVPEAVLKEPLQDISPEQVKKISHIPGFAQTREYVRRFHAALQTSFKCSCESSHRFLLELPNTTELNVGDSRFHLGLVICAQPPLSRGWSCKVSITFRPAEPDYMPKINSLCNKLSNSPYQGQHGQSGYLGSDTTGYCIVQVLSKVPRHENINVTELLSHRSTYGITRRQRYKLASLIIHSFLPLAQTPLRDDDLPKYGLIFLDRELVKSAACPYLEFYPVSEHPLRPPRDQAGKKWKGYEVRHALKNLGIVLLELSLGHTVEASISYKNHLSINGDAHDATSLLTAFDMVESMTTEADLEMGKAIKRCLTCNFKEELDLDEEVFVQELYHSVVLPWQHSMSNLSWNENE